MKGVFQKAFGWIKRVFGRYEAAITRWGDRSLLYSSLQDARFDVSEATRKELQRKHRYWVENSPLVQRIRNLFIQFSSGVSGLQVVPNAGDDDFEDSEDWNHARQESWQRWARSPEVNTNLTLGQCCIQWAGGLFDGGEVFIHKVWNQRAPSRQPQIETIECHRVQTPSDLRESRDIIDGIRYEISQDGGIGKPLSYFVQINLPQQFLGMPNVGQAAYGTDSTHFAEIPASDMLHVFKARRPGQLRGIPEGFSGMNTLHDYEDLHMMEMQVARMASQIGNVETNPTGEIDTAATRRTRLNIQSITPGGQVVTKTTDQMYNVVLGAHRIALKAGDSLKQFQVDRPSIATQNYWDLLISQICCAYNVPKLLVVPYSLQGTVTRADLDICANAFRANFELLAWALQQLYEWQTTWAVRFDRTMDGPYPADFTECIIRPPRAPNVDIGYTAQALQIELQIGTKTLQDVYAERQQDWRHQLRQIAETEAFIDRLAEEFDLDPNRISQKAKQSTASSSKDAEDEPKPTKEVETSTEAETA